MQMKYLWKSGFRHKWVTMALVLQQGPENRLDVCFSSSWVQYKIFSATHLTNAFQHFSLLIPITQPIITSQLTSNSISHSPSLHLQLMRKGSALHFSTGRDILESGKVGRSSQRRMEKDETKIIEIQLENAKLTSLLLLSALRSQPAPPFCTCQIPPLGKEKQKKGRGTSNSVFV